MEHSASNALIDLQYAAEDLRECSQLAVTDYSPTCRQLSAHVNQVLETVKNTAGEELELTSELDASLRRLSAWVVNLMVISRL